jgi:putative flippase GtrA
MPAFVLNRATVFRLARFLMVGGTSAVVQLLIMHALDGRMTARPAFQVSWFLSTCVHYVLNRFWALKSDRKDTARQLGDYVLVVLLSLAINTAAFEFFYSVVGLGKLWSTFLAIPPSTLVVFVLLNYRVFRSRGSNADSA